MSWLDKLLGRGKKAVDDMTGDSSMKSEGMHQQEQAMGSEPAGSGEQTGQEGPAEHEGPGDQM
jgi:uncharacterized protein YjbJ (UPF0337 family)